jgi:hypothetical protein
VPWRVRRSVGEGQKEVRKNCGIKKSSKSMINIIIKNNTMIRVLAIELLDTILLYFLMINSLLKN